MTSALLLGPLLGSLLVSLGCTSAFDQHRSDLLQYHASGRYDLASASLSGKDIDNLYGFQNRILLRLERGATALALDDDAMTLQTLEEAEEMVELTREKSTTETIGQWLVNDRVAQYLVEPYEDLYINVLKLLAQLEAGRLAGGASVEARRLGRKSQLLRNEYIDLKEALVEEAEGPVAKELEQSEEGEGEFIESPLGTYLAALTFLELGDGSNFDVASRRLLSSMEIQATLQPQVRPSAFEHVGRMRADTNDLLVVALSGRGPQKVAKKHGPYVVGSTPVYFELPEIKTNPSEAASVVVEIENGEGGRLELVEDFGAIASENHRRHLPLIHARTYARAIAKSTAVTVASEVVGGSENDMAELFKVVTVLGGMLFLQATEKADLRCWSMLPGQAHVGVFDLPEGTQRVRVVYRGAGGAEVHATPWQEVEIRSRGLQSLVTHFWR